MRHTIYIYVYRMCFRIRVLTSAISFAFKYFDILEKKNVLFLPKSLEI